MEFKPKNREWVKNAAIAFLAVLLVLTFFSNTIMNRTLPEVATQYVESGPITAKVRGTGTVTANGNHQVKAEQTRDIRAVMVKVGQEVEAGDVLFVLGQGASEELEAAQEALRTLQVSYQKAAINIPTHDYTLLDRKIALATEALDAAKAAEDRAFAELGEDSSLLAGKITEAQANLEQAKKDYDALLAANQESEAAAQKRVDDAADRLNLIMQNEPKPSPSPENPSVDDTQTPETSPAVTASAEPMFPSHEEWEKEKNAANEELTAANLALNELKEHNALNLSEYQKRVDTCQAILDRLLVSAGPKKEAYDAAVLARKNAENDLFNAKYELEQQKVADQKNDQLASIDLSDIGYQIEQQKKKIKELSGGEDNEVTAKVSGTIQTVDCTSGDTKLKDDLLCTIEVPDMGYNLSFSVTNDQARRLKPGDTATVSNYYWGNSITATLSTIKVDPKNPQTNKLLTFELEGDVNAGSELTLSVGQKSANYDVVIPNSAIRNDTNGSFVLKIEAKNSPLGNRYIARRVSVEVLAADDVNSAVTGDLGYGDYVITTSNAPVKTGDQVRMADS